MLLGSWRRAARNVRLRRGRETKLAGLTRQAVHRIVSGATLRAWRRCVARRLEVRGLVAHALLQRARRRSAAVLGEWRRAAATARKRLREFVRARAERRTRAGLEAWRVTAAALRAQAAWNRQALEHCRRAASLVHAHHDYEVAAAGLGLSAGASLPLLAVFFLLAHCLDSDC